MRTDDRPTDPRDDDRAEENARLARFAAAAHVFLAFAAGGRSESLGEFLAAHQDLRDLLEQMFESTTYCPTT